MDIAYAYHEVENVKDVLRECRINVESFHDQIYRRALVIAESIAVQESSPHLASRQQHRSNIQATNCNDFYRLNLIIPLLDHLMSELETRFDEASCHHITEFLLLLPSANADEASSHSLDGLLSFYDNDLPHPLSLSCELECGSTNGGEKRIWLLSSILLKKPYHMLTKIFSQILECFLASWPLSVTSCECESYISMLKLIF